MSLQERAIATRWAVLEAAATVFGAKGYAAASVADILEEAGVTKGAMYFHFPSKEAVLDAIIAEQSLWRSSVPLEVVQQNPLQGAVDLSYAFGDALLNDVMLRASIRVTIEQGTFGAQSTRPYADWLTVALEIFTLAATKRQLRDGIDPEVAAFAVTSSVTGAQLVSEAMTGREDLLRRLHDMWTLYLPAIARPGARARLDLSTDSRLAVLRSHTAAVPDLDQQGGLAPAIGPTGPPRLLVR